MTPETLVILAIVLIILSIASYVTYTRLIRETPLEVPLTQLEAFGAGQITALSLMATPGKTRTFSAKTEAAPEVAIIGKRRKPWYRDGEVRFISIGMRRF